MRTAGFLFAIYGLWQLWGGVETVVENLFAADSSDQTSSFTFFADGIPATIGGIIIFFIADFIVRLAYGRPAPDETHQPVVQRPAVPPQL